MQMRRSSLAVVLLLLFVMASPLYSNDVRATEGRSSTATTLTYIGEATSVQLVGEWDWNTALEMNNSSGVWSVDVELSEGLYCYKIVVDGTYLFDPATQSEYFVMALRIPSFEWMTTSDRIIPQV